MFGPSSATILALLVLPAADAKPSAAAVEHFEKQVRPVLVEKCVSCHGPKTQRGGLRVDSRAALLKGGDSGPSLKPGDPDNSLILKAIRHQGDLKMPPKAKDRLDDQAVVALTAWVKAGAPWPGDEGAKPALSSVELARKTHWSFRPVARPKPPAVKDSGWSVNPIDRFVLARLEAKGLTPSRQADRRTLIRRLTFDLLGLPPSIEDVEAFVHDVKPDAYERLVDRLIASPALGERWGRHWLDVARYADTKGYVFQEERRYPYSYTYRDYVVSSFNADLPYDRFVVEQLAADRLPMGNDRSALAAMGFLTLGRRFLNNVHDIIDDRIDVVGRGLMGLTVSCARCHDHKFDPVPMKDYYSLYGVFASSVEPAELPLLRARDPNQGPTPFEAELSKRRAEVEAFVTKALGELRRRAADQMLTAARPSDGPREPGQRLAARWRPYLAQAARKHHPVLSPWLAFARLPEKEFASRAAGLAATVAANDTQPTVNPLVAKAFEGPPPASLADVAKRYEKLFHGADDKWRLIQKSDPKVTRLPDASQEEIRQVLYGTASPLNIPAGEVPRILARDQRNRYTALKRKVDQWLATGPGAPARAMVLSDAATPTQPHVLLRGNPGNRGPAVPRQFLEILAPGRKPFADGSGRLELARAIASADNPLTARVMANRLWMHLFGQGLVRTPGDFGTRGDPPSHPELLDWLASEFVASGWSVKATLRQVVLSATYRQSSDDSPAALAADPENTLLWRMNRKRLELEPLRDALLAVAGSVDRTIGGPGVEITRAPFPARRSVYAFIERQNLPGVFRTFDLASPDSSTPKRHATTVPQQSLFLMNSPFVQQQARALAARSKGSDEARIDHLHRLVYARPPTPEEMVLGLEFVRRSASGKLTAWEQYAQVLLLANEFAFVD